MGESLGPTLLSRVSQALRPDWMRTVRARRIAAGGLVLLAGIAALRPNPDDAVTQVVVASRDLGPGMALTLDDIRLDGRSATAVPDGSLTQLGAAVGSTLAGPARRGEVLTDVRLLGSRLAQAVAGSDARIVPLHLADAALVELVRPGDLVDILAAPESGGRAQVAQVLATDAVVVLVSATPQDRPAAPDPVVLVSLPAHAANAVAGAALAQTVTLTLH